MARASIGLVFMAGFRNSGESVTWLLVANVKDQAHQAPSEGRLPVSACSTFANLPRCK